MPTVSGNKLKLCAFCLSILYANLNFEEFVKVLHDFTCHLLREVTITTNHFYKTSFASFISLRVVFPKGNLFDQHFSV